MCDKSLATKTCEFVASCGISVRFQTLFHTQGQVAHALLTRPPLSLKDASRRINPLNSVRLECVMHAASVHPEPGSNSLKNGILNSLFRVNLKSFSELFFLSFFYFSTLCSKLLTRIFRSFRLLFNFQGPLCASRFERSCSISHYSLFVNTFFQFF